MSQENVEVVRRVYEAAARRDADAVLACYEPSVEWDVSRSPMARLVGGGVYKIVRVMWFPTRDEALDASGLSE